MLNVNLISRYLNHDDYGIKYRLRQEFEIKEQKVQVILFCFELER